MENERFEVYNGFWYQYGDDPGFGDRSWFGILVRNTGKEYWSGRNGLTTQSFWSVVTKCLETVRKT